MKSRFILSISFFYLLALSAVSIEAKQIPLEKLICYGEGSSVSISPDGKFYASMVPSGEVSCDITDPEEDLAVPVLVVINLETMEPKLYSGTQINNRVTSATFLNNEQLLIRRSCQVGAGDQFNADCYSLYVLSLIHISEPTRR